MKRSDDAVPYSVQARLAALRGDLQSGLAGLPAPANEYQVMVPDENAGDDRTADGEAMEEDAADVKARLRVGALGAR